MDESQGPEKRFFVEVNGQRYGPASVAILTEWVVAGRVTPGSKLIEEGTGRELMAEDLPELFAGQSGPTMSPPPMAAPYPTQKNSTIWWVILGGCGVVSCLGLIILAAIVFPVFAQAKKAAQRAAEMSRIKQLNISLLMYANDFDNKLPPVMDSVSALKPYLLPYAGASGGDGQLPSIFESRLPEAGETLGNRLLAGKSLDTLTDPKSTVMIYDSKPLTGGSIVGFADGHVESRVQSAELQQGLSTDPFTKSE